MREPYICPHCDQRSTRWWNLKIHVKRRHGEFLPGKSSCSNTPWHRSNSYHTFGSATVCDSVGDTFQPKYFPQQAPVQYSIRPTMDDQRYGTGLSPETKRKIDELTRLMNKYPQFHTNPNGIIRWAINGAVKGDNQFLDKKLEQLRIIDFYKG